MKQKVNQIYWRVGQEITPDTFIQADNYTGSQHNLIRRLISRKYHGLLPLMLDAGLPPLTANANLSGRDISIEQLDCHGTTKAGYLIQFENYMLKDVPTRRLTIPQSNAKAFYVVVRINPLRQVLIEPVDNEEAPQAHAAYEFDIKELNQIAADELAFLKIRNNGYSAEIDDEYIPPCMSVNSCALLFEMYETFKELFAEIHKVIEHKKDQFRKLLYPLTLLYYDLDEFSLSNPPIGLIRLIKKFIVTFQFFIPDIRTISTPDVFNTYQHNDVDVILKALLSYLQDLKEVVGKVEVIIEEDFTPKI